MKKNVIDKWYKATEMKKNVVDKWYEATEEVTKFFIKRYFPQYQKDEDLYWVADCIGTVLCVGDYYFDLDRIIEAIELEATFEQLINFYDMELEHALENKHLPINFSNYVKYGMKIKK